MTSRRSATNSRSSPPRRRRSTIWTTPPPARSAARAAEALWHFETTARANVKRGVYRLADEATAAFHKARAEVAAYIGAADRRRGRVHLGLHAGDQHRGPRPGRAAAARRRDPGLRARASQQPGAVADGGAATGAVVRAIPVTDRGPPRPTTGWTSSCRQRTRVIAVTHASNVTGAVTEVGRLRDAADAVGRPDPARRRPAGAARPARRAGAGLRPVRVLGPQDVRAHRRRRACGRAGSCWPSCRRSWAAAR